MTALDENGVETDYWVYNEEDASQGDSLYTIGNLEIDAE